MLLTVMNKSRLLYKHPHTTGCRVLSAPRHCRKQLCLWQEIFQQQRAGCLLHCSVISLPPKKREREGGMEREERGEGREAEKEAQRCYKASGEEVKMQREE